MSLSEQFGSPRPAVAPHQADYSVGLGTGVGRGLGVIAGLAVGVGRGVLVGLTEGVAVAVGDGGSNTRRRRQS